FCGLACAMVLVGAASSYLRRKIWAEHAIATQSSKDLAELHSRQKSLIEGLADGVIITDNSGTIFSINQAACGLLQVSEQESVGQPLRQLCKNLPTNGEELFIDNAGEGSFEFEITPSASSEPIKIVFSRRAILDGAGTNLGSVCIFRNVTELRTAEEQLALQERMAEMLAKQHEPTSLHPLKLHGFTGESAVMHKVLALIERVAASDANVLISGESGTGKELAARAIHHGGARARAPFIAVNCGAVPETLIESQLFGHKKGSFTGADADQSGLFKQAHTGTLFLDEIAELPLLLQSKLLRAIQEKTIRPIGADREMPIDVRIIAATNKTLKQEVAAGKFREDLYYRLNVVGINLPPLRNRKEDIPLLVNSILKRLIKGSATPLVPPATMQILMNYDYPGNVRELENLLERAVVLGGEVLLPEHLPEHLRCEESTLPDEEAKPKETRIIIDEQLELPVDLDALLSTIEKKYLEVALLKTNGVKKKAADLLGMNFRSFRYRLQKFGMAE
ncbi:MAG: sigma 54-interacting transcriptional regulator, partial [Deltaproteobacteria bacterium]|nr:sigma 54-interacting transcriptional regulator [Deltaproteobacteria bacterium]